MFLMIRRIVPALIVMLALLPRWGLLIAVAVRFIREKIELILEQFV